MAELDRRTFLAASLATVLVACSGDGTDSATDSPAPTTAPPRPPPTPTPAPAPPTTSAPTVVLPSDPFRLGVASGEPTASSVILWTRLAPDPLVVGGGMPAEPVAVAWQVMADEEGEEWEDVVADGTAIADPADAHALHIDVTGLEPATWYRYRFVVDPWVSTTGRTRTAPAAGETTPLVVGQASCQDWQDGYYAAHRDLATAGLDLLLFLGDYIYEAAAAPVGGEIVRSHDSPEPMTLDEYRARYALYKGDADLQAAHAACPWVLVWDDHEVENNYAADAGQDGGDPEAFRQRRAAAYRAWWEHQPVRLPSPDGPDLPIYRRLDLGDLATILLVDGRQYRSDQACGAPALSLEPPCPEITAPGRTMLGDEQEAWLAGELARATTAWTVIANQTVVADLRFGEAVLNHDQWDGYPQARERLLAALAERRDRPAVVLTGDIHLGGAAVLSGADGAPVATELVCTSISSRGLDPSLSGVVGSFDGVVHADLVHRGWTRHTISTERWEAEFRVVEDAADPASAVRPDVRLELHPDRAELTPLV